MRTWKLFSKILFVLILFLPGIMLAGDTLSLEQAINIGLEKNFDIQIKKNELSIASNNATRQNAGFSPTIDLTLDDKVALDYNQSKNGDEEIQRNNNAFSNTINAGVEMNWTAFDGKKRNATLERLNAIEELGDINLKIEMENTIFDIAAAYFDIVKQQLIKKTLQSSLIFSEERVKLEEAKSSVGKGSKLNVSQASVDRNMQVTAITKQDLLISNAKIILNNLLFRDPATKFEIEDTIILGEQLALDLYKNDATSKNYLLQLLLKTESISDMEYKETKSALLPQIGLNAGVGYYRKDGTNQQPLNLNQSFSLFQTYGAYTGVNLRWNLFNGGQVKRELANIKLEKENTRLQMQKTQQDVESTMEQAYASYLTAKKVYEMEQENYALANESLNIISEKFRIGSATSLELKDAQRSFEDAGTRITLAGYDAKIAELELQYLSGNLGR